MSPADDVAPADRALVTDVAARASQHGDGYFEFLTVDSLSLGVFA